MKPLLVGALAGLMALSNAMSAEEFPKRKSGLWIATTNIGMPNVPAMETKLCVDAATDAELLKNGMAAGSCTRRDLHRIGDTVTVDSECTMGTRKVITHGTIAFAGDTAYHGEFKSRSDPPVAGGQDRTSVQDGRWSGPCPADMKPGDMIAPNGMKMNLNEVMKGSR
jgi:hypothetical protein